MKLWVFGKIREICFHDPASRLNRELWNVSGAEVIDLTSPRTESGYQHPLSNNALPQEIAEILEEGRRYLEITASEKPMLPKPKRPKRR